MYVFRRFGLHVVKFFNSLTLIFRFFGHLFHSLKDVLFGELSISWFNMVEILYYSGARLVLPLLFICFLITFSEAQTIYFLFNSFHLGHKALPVAQNVLTHEVLPIFIAFILCIQAALHLINTRMKRLGQSPEEVILEHVWPIVVGLNITSLLLFTYTIVVILISFFITFHYMLRMTSFEYLLHVTSATTVYDVMYSAFKTLTLCAIVSLSAGYYYYEAAVRHISLRKAVSRIMTRGSFWLILTSIYITFTI
ncbi:ABC transporter permease [Legionella hackeliae]|uniref:ABC transport system permease protein n=1 Tax=Legionella hackeliae TaxID=449 RepID=A0A0A8UVD3_LEGHA|nr:ABC transporter permease [Legionella hackeliae]KTD15166.1 putative ABC transport system permease [Legionella hackeliae]CEK11471.1 ABC transport system permease protein [Legionella hackeliae]STX48241.1 ABC transport system permease [Legionella hackeliae]